MASLVSWQALRDPESTSPTWLRLRNTERRFSRIAERSSSHRFLSWRTEERLRRLSSGIRRRRCFPEARVDDERGNDSRAALIRLAHGRGARVWRHTGIRGQRDARDSVFPKRGARGFFHPCWSRDTRRPGVLSVLRATRGGFEQRVTLLFFSLPLFLSLSPTVRRLSSVTLLPLSLSLSLSFSSTRLVSPNLGDHSSSRGGGCCGPRALDEPSNPSRGPFTSRGTVHAGNQTSSASQLLRLLSSAVTSPRRARCGLDVSRPSPSPLPNTCNRKNWISELKETFICSTNR